jgi:hypothetical protein
MIKKIDKRGSADELVFWLIVLLIALAGIIIFIIVTISPSNGYTYVGKIIDMEGGSSSNLILTLDTIGKTPYTVQNYCSNQIRIGQKVYKRYNSNYLYVEYKKGKYC